MNVGFMVAIGIIPALVAAIILIFASKKHRILYSIISAFFAVAFISGSFFHCQEEVRQNKLLQKSIKVLYTDISLAKEFAAEGDYEQAIKILTSLRNNLYSEEQTLLLARIYSMQENYSSALALYSKLLINTANNEIRKEAELVKLALGISEFDVNLLGQYESYNPAIDRGEAEALVKRSENAVAELRELISGKLKSDSDKNTSELVSLMKEINYLYDRFISTGAVDSDEAKDLYTDFKRALQECPGLEDDSLVRDSRTKVLLMTDRMSGLTSVLLDNPNEDELLVASELVIKGHITENQLADHMEANVSEEYEKVYDQIVKIYDKEYDSLTRKNRNSLKDYKNFLKEKIKNPATTEFSEILETVAETGTDRNRSKLYTQLARLESKKEFGDPSKYITEAVNSAPYSDDANYTKPMDIIIDAINNSQNASELKNVYNASEQAVENVCPIILPEEYRRPAEDKDGNPVYSDDKYNIGVSDWTSEKVSSVNIISVDALSFPEITLDVTIDGDNLSASKIKDQYSLYDCDVEIKDFTVKDFTKKKVEIVLVCDVSGSMDGSPVSNLRSAVSMFLDDKTSNESIGIVTFSSGVEDYAEIGSDSDELNEIVDRMYASGGTNIYSAVQQAIDMFSDNSQTFKIIVLMSDGQDGSGASNMTINNNIVSPCVENGIVIYSLGLGDVDINCLQTYTDGTGGTFLYAVDPSSLSSSYATLHNIIAGRYSITYTAKDQLTYERNARIQLKNDALSYSRRNYVLPDAIEDSGPEGSPQAELYSWIHGKSIYGLDTKLIYQSNKDTAAKLLCSGFDKNDNVSIKANGKLSYTIPVQFASEDSYDVTIPSGMATGKYELEITVNGLKLYLQNALIITAKIDEFTFGKYKFTSAFSETFNDGIKLSGCVTMNGWLKFKGDVTIAGDIENIDSLSYVTLYDENGATVEYNPLTAENLALLLAKCHKSVDITPLYGNRLYRNMENASDSEKYCRTDSILIPSFFEITAPATALYPDKIVINMNAFSTRLKDQNKLINKAELFSFQTSSVVTITNMNVGAEIEIKAKQNDTKYYPVNLGNTPIYAGKNNLELSLNTMAPSLRIKFGAKLTFLDADSLGLEVKWEGFDQEKVISGKIIVPKMIKIYADFDINTNISGIPVTFSEFALGIDNIDPDKSILEWTLEGQTKISAAKVSAVLPGLEKYVGDVSVASLDNTKLRLKLSDYYFKFSTELKLFDNLKLGSAEIEAGKNFSYTNALLNMNSETVSGLRTKLKVGIEEGSKDFGKWEKDNVNIVITGSVEFDMLSKVVGVYVNGNAFAEIRWWILNWSPFDLNGEAFIGMYTTHDNDIVFTVRGKGTDNKNNQFVQNEISWSQRKHAMVHTLDL